MTAFLADLRHPPASLRGRLVEWLVIAVGYGAACILFAGPSLPMVFTSVVWIPAGLAFGVVYICGYRVAPHLFVGGILGLLTRAIELDGTTPPGVTFTEASVAVLLESVIVVGHSVLGTWLVRRYVADRDFATLRGAAAFLLLAGPVACLVGSVLGPPAMYLRDIVDADGLGTVAFGFLVGDSMGVLLLAPIVAALAGPHEDWRERMQPLVLVTVAMVVALLSLHALVFRSEDERVERVFTALNEGRVEAANTAVARAENDMDRIGDLFRSSERNRDELLDEAQDRLQERLSGTSSVEVITQLEGGFAREVIVRGRTITRPVEATDEVTGDALVALHHPIFRSDATPPNANARVDDAIAVVRVELSPQRLLRDAAPGDMYQDAGVAIGSLARPGADPVEWRGVNVAAGRFLLDGNIRPQDILREHRSANVDRYELELGDRVVPIAAAPSVSFLRNETFLLSAMPLSIASMLLAFTVGVSALVLTGRNVLLARLVAERTEKLKRNERRYRSVVDSVAEVIFRADRDGVLRFVNIAWFEVVSPDDESRPEGRAIDAFVHSDDRAALRATLDLLPDDPGRVERVEVRLACDPKRWIEMRARHDSVEDAIVGTIIDTTLRRAVETEREQFVSMVSHEFRTPVTVIRGAIDTIEQREHDELPPLAARLMPAMRSSSGRLLRLVEDLLFAARVDAGTMQFVRRMFDVNSVVRSCVEVASVDAEAAGLKLTARLPSTAVSIIGDPDRIGQLVDNLVSNAIKYSGTGTAVNVALAVEDTEVVLEVADDGIGISHDDQQHLFDRFWRGGDVNHAASGTGLGLSICNQIVTAHGGTIRVVSALDAGSTFQVRLPLPAADIRSSADRPSG